MYSRNTTRTSKRKGVRFYFLLCAQLCVLFFAAFITPPTPLQAYAAEMEKLSSYTTYYNEEDKGRTKNIQLACKRIDGIILQAYGEFSFNQTVGKRTRSAGFQDAKIIIDGEFVVGVGGGVCQVSSTLYNAVLLAGLTVTESHPHSLPVSYVPPSRDAMVSSNSDLCVFNVFSTPVRLRAKAENGALKISVYGKNGGGRYEIISYITEEIPPPKPIVREGKEDKILRREKSGLKSESYLERYVGDVLIGRKRLRKDSYAAQQGIIIKKIA